jgi:hypothetical protein
MTRAFCSTGRAKVAERSDKSSILSQEWFSMTLCSSQFGRDRILLHQMEKEKSHRSNTIKKVSSKEVTRNRRQRRKLKLITSSGTYRDCLRVYLLLKELASLSIPFFPLDILAIISAMVYHLKWDGADLTTLFKVGKLMRHGYDDRSFFKAYSLRDGEKVCIRVLPEMSEREEFRGKLPDALDADKLLSSKYLFHARDFCFVKLSTLYILYEYYSITVTDLILEKSRLPSYYFDEMHIAFIVTQILDSLSYLQECYLSISEIRPSSFIIFRKSMC